MSDQQVCLESHTITEHIMVSFTFQISSQKFIGFNPLLNSPKKRIQKNIVTGKLNEYTRSII